LKLHFLWLKKGKKKKIKKKERKKEKENIQNPNVDAIVLSKFSTPNVKKAEKSGLQKPVKQSE